MYQNIGSAFMGFTCRKVDTGSLYQLLQVTYRIATLFLLTEYDHQMLLQTFFIFSTATIIHERGYIVQRGPSENSLSAMTYTS
ncbi:unnamed protein product, partial [Musa acuminata subsp. burmannicoides]